MGNEKLGKRAVRSGRTVGVRWEECIKPKRVGGECGVVTMGGKV